MSSDRRRSRRGFTLIELLVVIAIIATLAGVVAPALFSNVGRAKSTAARAQLEIFALALDAYRIDVGKYPTTDEGLAVLRVAPIDARAAALWRGPYLRQAVPADPWGAAWVYRSPSQSGPDGYELYSLGRDQRPDGAGEDADVTSWGGRVNP
ncbi:MAG: type II secretion system major pseudopilin GspG [Gemmatimonadaceae bacterium]|nr:type II secretion system major pseudopilin GspG [Gemmatimonadaceae bacterium]